MGGISHKKSSVKHVHPTVFVPAPEIVQENHVLKDRIASLESDLAIERERRGRVLTEVVTKEIQVENLDTVRRLNEALKENGELKMQMRKRPGELRELKVPEEKIVEKEVIREKRVYVPVDTLDRKAALAIAVAGAFAGAVATHYFPALNKEVQRLWQTQFGSQTSGKSLPARR